MVVKRRSLVIETESDLGRRGNVAEAKTGNDHDLETVNGALGNPEGSCRIIIIFKLLVASS